MKLKSLFIIWVALLMFSTLFISGVSAQTLSFGNSYLNQTLDGERAPNILATDFTLQWVVPDAGATYRARLHDDSLIWQRLEIGPRHKNISLFYSLDMTNISTLSGGGVRVSQSHQAGRLMELSAGVYDSGLCFEGAYSVERSGFVGRISYEYRKLGDVRWWGPSLSMGWGW